jgi:tRNA threonylcarbamoyladenosine biosynthesis protein TsaE
MNAVVKEITTRSLEETFALGRTLGRVAGPFTVMALEGMLGAGKTHLVRGIAQGAAVADANLVSSPTYVLLNIYPSDPANIASKTVFHLDAYRTASAEDFAAIGFEELLEEPGIVVVEWASKVAGILPEDRLEVGIEVVDEITRAFTFKATGKNAADILARL